jgi:hypothetical protein
MPKKPIKAAQARKSLPEAERDLQRTQDAHRALEGVLKRCDYDVDAAARELGMTPVGVAQVLARRGVTCEDLAVWEVADRMVARRVLRMRDKALNSLEEMLDAPDTQAIGARAAEITLNYSKDLEEKLQLTALAKGLEDRILKNES